jgi:pimeloyl-[acyl-carrier protein] methyl ester esterase
MNTIKKLIATAMLAGMVHPVSSAAKSDACAAQRLSSKLRYETRKAIATTVETTFAGKHFTVKSIVESFIPTSPGYDVILIPGLASPRGVWDQTVTQLRRRYRVHIVQIRGFGDDAGVNASGPVLEPFVQELASYIENEIAEKGYGKPAVIGHSMGGLSAAMIAARHPQLVCNILIQDSLPFIGLLFASNATVAMVEPQAKAMRDQGLAAGKQPANDGMLQTQSATPEGRAQVAKWSDTADYRVTMQAFYDVMTTDIRPELSKITVPVTLLYPYDPIVGPAEQVTALYTDAYAGLAGLKMKRIDNSRHFIMVDQPAKFAEEVDAFLAQ